jgi:hypothetical protein
MKPKRQKTKFWTVLTLANLLVMMYPVHMYVNAYTDEAQVIAAIAMVGMAFVMAITDVVSVVVAYN